MPRLPNGAHDDQVEAMTQVLLKWSTIPRETVHYFDEDEYRRQTQISPI